jgi:hypothetical protein
VTDDIVTRLRQKYSGQLPICTEAAEEIERLRKELGLVLAEYQRLEMRYLKAVRR